MSVSHVTCILMHIAEVYRAQFQSIEFVIYIYIFKFLFTYIVCLKSCISKRNTIGICRFRYM